VVGHKRVHGYPSFLFDPLPVFVLEHLAEFDSLLGQLDDLAEILAHIVAPERAMQVPARTRAFRSF